MILYSMMVKKEAERSRKLMNIIEQSKREREYHYPRRHKWQG